MCKLDFKGFKGHIFSNSIAQRLQESDIFSMHRQLMRIFLPVFWVRSCSKDFVKIAQSSIVNCKEVKHKDDYLLRRHSAPGTDISRSLNGKGLGDLFVRTSGLIIHKIFETNSSFNVK